MINSLKQAGNAYMKKPFYFMYATISNMFLNFISLLGAVGFFLVIYYLAAILDLIQGNVIPLAIVGVIAFLAYMVISNGLKGALIKSLKKSYNGERPHIALDLRYAISNGEIFFLITVIKMLVQAIIVAPIYLFHIYLTEPMQNDIVNSFIYLVMLFFVFLVEFPFSYAYIAAATKDLGVLSAIKSAFRFVKKKHMYALGLFFVYAVVWITFMIPLVNLITLLVAYPILYTSLIILYEKTE
ncbi:hypothetical protein JXB01_00670 [Candidatus Micrarchaeota archaeon]|nr:hypothetical protein [Candidatus Micrarchaeota archaeon]